MASQNEAPISSLEYHVLLAMAEAPRYGYAIKSAIEEESAGTLTPRAGSLYRVIARLMEQGWVEEADPDGEVAPHPGRARRYYGLTADGRVALSAEAARLRDAAALAEERLGAVKGRP